MFGRLLKGLPFRKDKTRVLMLGLDAGGKTTILYNLKLGEVVTTIPTIGFNVETVEYAGFNMTVWDVGGRDKIRPLWRYYYQNTAALIFVVDANDKERLRDDGWGAHHELHNILREDELNGVPLLVFANKQDLPNALSVARVRQELQLDGIRDRRWFIQGSCATSGDGLLEGFTWLRRVLKDSTFRPDLVEGPFFSMAIRRQRLWAQLATLVEFVHANRDSTIVNSVFPLLNVVGDFVSEEPLSHSDFVASQELLHTLEAESSPPSFLASVKNAFAGKKEKDKGKSNSRDSNAKGDEVKDAVVKVRNLVSSRELMQKFCDTPFFKEVTGLKTRLLVPYLISNAMPTSSMPLKDIRPGERDDHVYNTWLKKKPLSLETMVPRITTGPAPSSTGRGPPPPAPTAIMSDEDMLKYFFAGNHAALQYDQDSHLINLRIMFTLLQRYERRDAVKRIFEGFSQFNARYPYYYSFHFTITYFWIQILDYLRHVDKLVSSELLQTQRSLKLAEDHDRRLAAGKGPSKANLCLEHHVRFVASLSKTPLSTPGVAAPALSGRPALLVLMHGLGSNEDDLFELSGALHINESAIVTSVRGPNDWHGSGHCWFQLEIKSDGTRIIDADQAEESRKLLIRFIDEACSAYGADSNRVFLAGFSQGAQMGASVSLTRPDLVKGLVMMSGRILPEIQPLIDKDKVKDLPVLVVHGTADSVLPISHGRASRDLLQTLGVSLDYREYQGMEHSISPDTLRYVVKWLNERNSATELLSTEAKKQPPEPPCSHAEAFLNLVKAHRFLLDTSLFLTYYTEETLFSLPRAETEFVLPDKKPLPSIVEFTAKK